jgi:hypothetical protein
MARCGFFSLDVSWFDEEWYINVPDKDKANVSCLDIALTGLVMATYDIPTFNKKYLTPEQVAEIKESFEIPLTEKVLKFRRICDVTGWRKGKIMQYLHQLQKYGVILFRVEDKNRVSVLHIKAYERLAETQKNYFSKLGVNTETIQAYKIKVAQSYDNISNLNPDESLPKKRDSQVNKESKSIRTLKIDIKDITEDKIGYMSVSQCKTLSEQYRNKLSDNQLFWLSEQIKKYEKKNKNFLAG